MSNEFVNEKVMKYARAAANNLPKEQAVSYLRGMASVESEGATSRAIRELIAEVESR